MRYGARRAILRPIMENHAHAGLAPRDDLPPVCDRCVAAGGLCKQHEVGVLPLLDDAMLRRLYALQGAKKPPRPPTRDPAVERALRREDRKRKKREHRIRRAVQGEFTRSRPASLTAPC